jgi:cysteine synthase A
MTVADNILELIGRTPVVRLNRIIGKTDADVFLKLEFFNPGGSVKDRIAWSMITEAEKRGDLKPGDVIIEPTSGNTGIGLALVAAAKGYRTILVMPDTMSKERRNLLKAYGAELVLTPGSEGMKGAVNKAVELSQEHDNAFLPQQFKNPDNVKVHYETTAQEVFDDFGTELDAFVAGVGTGGTITGVGRLLKEKSPHTHIVAVEPSASPILQGGKPGPHKIQGIGANFVPDILDTEIYDEVIGIDNEEAFEWARKLAREEGILGGISTGAAVAAASRIARRLGEGKKVLAVAPSNGERYLSTPLYQFEEE